MSEMRKVAARLGVVALNVIVFFIEEAWIIAAVAILPFWIALVVVVALLSCFAITSSWLCGQSDLPDFARRWFERQKSKASKRLTKVMAGTVWMAALTTAVVVGPATSAVMLALVGVKKERAYIIDVAFSFCSGSVWCLIYGGGILLIKKLV
jgi:hypothetical protein